MEPSGWPTGEGDCTVGEFGKLVSRKGTLELFLRLVSGIPYLILQKSLVQCTFMSPKELGFRLFILSSILSVFSHCSKKKITTKITRLKHKLFKWEIQHRSQETKIEPFPRACPHSYHRRESASRLLQVVGRFHSVPCCCRTEVSTSLQAIMWTALLFLN